MGFSDLKGKEKRVGFPTLFYCVEGAKLGERGTKSAQYCVFLTIDKKDKFSREI
jgi:hypothetical protein